MLVWGLGLLLFPQQLNGLLLVHEGIITGSELNGQNFTGPEYFHPRPSAAGIGYDAANSGGSNLGPLSKQLINTVAERVKNYRQDNGLSRDALVPVDA